MTTSPFVKLDGVAKRWNGQLGVEGISLDIPEGSFTALLGPVGVWKVDDAAPFGGAGIARRGQDRDRWQGRDDKRRL